MMGSCRHKGFTLVEVLLAVAIFGIAVSTLFVTFNTIITSVDPLKKGITDYETAQNALDRIRLDLMSLCLTRDSAYTPPDRTEEHTKDRFRFVAGTKTVNDKTFSNLRFASFEHLSFGREEHGRIGIITYYTLALEDGTTVLKRRDIAKHFYDETNTTDEGSDDPVLCDRIKTFELKFIDQDGEEQENWDSDASDFGYGTPVAVNIRLEIGDENRSETFTTTLLLPVVREKDES